MPRLRRADCSAPGIRRRRRGKGFEYLDHEGNRITESTVLERIRELSIPPAWEEVWICPYPFGHIQATGTDAAGRKQYRYHDLWRERRDREKFDSMIDFAEALPKLRRKVAKDLKRTGMERERVLACAVRLLDRGFFRIGSEDYAEENDTYGIATMERRHVTIEEATVRFDYESKGGQRRRQNVIDPEVAAILQNLKTRRGGGDELLAYKGGHRWLDVKSPDINDYVKETIGGDFSAKDFRTWGGTVLAAVALAVSAEAATASKTARKRAKTRAVKEVAHHLGNTPAVARASYIDPRVIDRYLDGFVIDVGQLAADPEDTAIQGDIEAAVLDLIEEEDSAYVAPAEELLAATA